MSKLNYVILVLSFFMMNCNSQENNTIVAEKANKPEVETSINVEINKKGLTIKERFLPNKGFKREKTDSASFAHYLQNLKLKPYGSSVMYYNGDIKPNNNVYCSVIDMDISERDLQQCADAVMRLKGEYLFHQKRYNEIKFNFLSDGKPRYFNEYAKGDFSYQKFLKYMDYIFAFANTSSLSDELESVNSITELQIGDVFVEKKQPFGHAVIIVDKAVNEKGEIQFLLAQSYMPAQETQILINPKNNSNSPWFSANSSTLQTPEWNFKEKHLKRIRF